MGVYQYKLQNGSLQRSQNTFSSLGGRSKNRWFLPDTFPWKEKERRWEPEDSKVKGVVFQMGKTWPYFVCDLSRKIKQKLAESGPPVLALVNGNKNKGIQGGMSWLKQYMTQSRKRLILHQVRKWGRKEAYNRLWSSTDSPAEIRFNELGLNDSWQFFLREDRIEKQKERRVHQRECMKDPL